jgi:hypothetical protein
MPLVSWHGVSAQEAGTIVSIPGGYLDSPENPGRPTGETGAQARGRVDVLADGELCGSIDLSVRPPGDLPDYRLALGAAGQPEACSRKGAELTFTDARGYVLFDNRVLGDESATEGVITLSSLAAAPTRSSDDNRTMVMMPYDIVDRAPNAPSSLETIGEMLGSLDVYANGELCGALPLTDPGRRDQWGNASFELGTAAQPTACGTPGATLSFAAGPARPFHFTQTLRPGKVHVVSNIALGPTGTGAGPTTVPAPGPPAAGTGQRPGATNANMRFALVALAAAVASGGLLLARRRP